MWGLTEDNASIVGEFDHLGLHSQTVCIKSLVISHPVRGDYRVCPTIGAIDVLISQILTIA